ncbi:Ig-like domain-containing protein [Clostridium psychrophilum]|uniref:Ig-like domain-containing protein n=1 Tax=Clostridium psychrophilum TaxID=132926 RepID=UPI001C0B2533|nr:Ig-like domain-containing protein [Clostridium psychrophilum]MBU3181845.1 Ig-like domain-containing protein [Clostridium psychrophilum]
MKKRQPNHIICFLLMFLLVFMNIQVFAKPVIRVSKVSINKTTDTLVVGQTDTIKAKFTPTNATNRGVKWTSTNTTIAKIDIWGKVTSLKAGTVTITGTTADKGLKVYCKVTVKAKPVIRVSKVSINKTTDTLVVGQTDTIKAKFTPANATNRGVKWTSSNTTIAKIDIWGKVTSLKAGTVTITGTTADKGLKVYCKITVKAKPVIHVSKVSINKTTDTLIVGQTDTIKAKFTPANATNRGVKWTSSNNTIAKIDIWGKVTSLKAGTVTITGTTADKGLKVYCKLTVKAKPAIKVASVNLNKNVDILVVGSTDTLISTINPTNATNKNVTWTSSDASIAKVDNSGKITAVGAGKVTITATTADGNKKATCSVTVNNPIIKVISVSLNKTSDTLITGNTDNLTSTIAPSNATNKVVTWKSSDVSIATVDNSGKVTAVKAGIVTITVTTADGSKIANCAVTVNDPIKVSSVILNKTTDTLITGEIDNLTSTIAPSNAANKNVTWKSSDSAIATVDGIGKVTSIKAGTATITVTTEDGSKIATCNVIVNDPKVASITLNKTIDNLIVGDIDALTSEITPTNAGNKDITWTSSDSAIATVDSIGKVTAVKAGTTIITATTVDGSKTATCNVTVESLAIESITDISNSVYEGDNYSLPQTVEVNMNNGTKVDKAVVWDSSAVDTSKVGLVTYTGTVEGYKGSAKVNLNVRSIASSLKVTVNSVNSSGSSVSIGNTTIFRGITSYGITFSNSNAKNINIEKIETFDNGNLYNTYRDLVINANSAFSALFKFDNVDSSESISIIVYVNINGKIIPCQYNLN